MNKKIIMVPPEADTDESSNAEKKMFDIFKNLQFKYAYVFHSIGLPRHKSKRHGEIDFVVVCEKGIACIEVKGGRVESPEVTGDEAWHFIDSQGSVSAKNEGPFDQVKGNMDSLQQDIRQHFQQDDTVKKALFACGVVFPDIDFTEASEDMPSEMVYDQRTTDITVYINQIFDYWLDKRREGTPTYQPMNLSITDIDKISKYLRPWFRSLITMGDKIGRAEKKVLELTKQQAQVMDSLVNNDHLLISGGAGTGKTALAMDFAVRQSKTKDVLYIVYNKNLSNHLRKYKPSENDRLQIRNLNSFLNSLLNADIQAKSEEEIGEYFSYEQPREFSDYIKGLSEEELNKIQYDVLILDEGQDTVNMKNLEVFDHLLRGGLDKGKWAVFYDTNQNIYNDGFQDGKGYLDTFSNTKLPLSINCRNTIQIGDFCEKESHVLPSPKEYLMGNGEEVKEIHYKNDKDFSRKINDILSDLRHEEVDMDDVVILSPYKYDNEDKGSMKATEIPVRIVGDDTNTKNDFPYYCTIQGFKGLESDVVILIDIDKIKYDNYYKKDIYLAATRAIVKLYVLGDETFWQGHGG